VWARARLTGRRRLSAELGLSPATSDADLVIAAVARWGMGAAGHLNGPWAFALAGPGGVTRVVRDAIGLMPAYWARGADGRVRVSDSLQELADVPGVSLEPDGEHEAARLLRAPGLAPLCTPAVGIHRVPPGSVVTIDDRRWRVEPWWHPDRVERIRGIEVGEAAERLRSLLLAAINDALDSCGPDSRVAAHVSGGLDSTVIAVCAQRRLRDSGRSLDCVGSWSPHPSSLRVEDLGARDIPYDERDLVTGLAESLGVPALYGPAHVEEAEWLVGLDPIRQPRVTIVRESHLIPQFAKRGVTDVLSGWGGDEFASFNGRGAARDTARALRLGHVAASFRDHRSRGMGRTGALRAVLGPAVPLGLPSRRRTEPSPPELRQRRRIEAVRAEFPELAEAYEDNSARMFGAAGSRAALLAMVERGHLSWRIESWHEAGRRFGITYRYPLLDLRLAEWALAMPPEVFRVGDHSRRAYRMAVTGLVPPWVVETSKDDPVLLEVIRRDTERRRAEGLPLHV